MKKFLSIVLMMFNVIGFQTDDVSGGISSGREIIKDEWYYDSEDEENDLELAQRLTTMLDERDDLQEDEKAVLKRYSDYCLKDAKDYRESLEQDHNPFIN